MIENRDGKQVTFGLLAALVSFHVTAVLTDRLLYLTDAFAFSMPRLLAGQWWVTLSAGIVHTDIGHLLYNVAFLYLFGSACEDELGPKKMFAIFVTGIVSGSLFFGILFPTASVVGASGGVFAVMTAVMLVAPGRPIRDGVHLPLVLVGVIFVVPALTNVFSLAENIANIGHVGGTIAGALMAAYWEPERAAEGIWAVIGFALLIIALSVF